MHKKFVYLIFWLWFVSPAFMEMFGSLQDSKL